MAEGDFLGQITAGAKGLGSGDVFEIFDLPIFAKLYFFLKVMFWMGLFLLGGIAYWKYWMQYKVKVTLKKKIGEGGVETVEDIAKVITDEQGKTKLQLMKTRNGKKVVTCPIPEAKFKGKKGKKDHFTMWMDDNFELHPIDLPRVIENHQRLTIRPQERAAWGRMEDEIIARKFQRKDALLKYATPAILMTACITAFLIFFFASKEIGSGLTSLAVEFRQIAASCTQMG